MDKLQVGDKVKILPYPSFDGPSYAGEITTVVSLMDGYADWVIIDIDGRPHAWPIAEL